MADMCGPSNALSNFQKHSTVDRTLQQDRLISRQSNAQGFRSSPGPNAQLLDPEFEAFQAGNLPLDNQFHAQRPGFSQQGYQPEPGPSNWAADFQRMNISSPAQQQFQQQGLGGQVQQRDSSGRWHTDFVRQQGQLGGQEVARADQQRNFMQQYPVMSGGLGMGMGSQLGGYAGPQQAQFQTQQPQEQFDEEAFAKAFDEAEQAEQKQREEVKEDTDTLQERVLLPRVHSPDSLTREASVDAYEVNQEPIGADTIEDHRTPEGKEINEDPDLLSRTAARLLESVSKDNSEKMKGSAFMQLMREFRDGNLGVKHQDIVDREGQIADPGTSDVNTKVQISTIFHFLRTSLLDRDRPFHRNPATVRTLLLNLLLLSHVMHTKNYLTNPKEITRLERTLQSVVASPSLNGLPSVRILAISVLNQVRKSIPARYASWSDDDDGNEGTNPHLEEEIGIDDILSANRLIKEFKYDPTIQRSDDMNDPEYEYISTLINGYDFSPSTTDAPDVEHLAAESIVGYTLPLEAPSSQIHAIHAQRVEDILGPNISSVLRILRDHGLLCFVLEPSEVLDLVRVFEMEGGGKGERFRAGLVRMQQSVRERLEVFLGRFEGAGMGRVGDGELEVLERGGVVEGRVEGVKSRLNYLKSPQAAELLLRY